MAEEAKAEETETEAESNAAPALKKPVLLGRKLGMLQHFKEDGSAVAATVIAAEANVVTYVRTRERDGYTAIQIGFGRAKKKERLSGGERVKSGDKVHVSGMSKGKGFQGPVHLHHFTRGPKSHGSDHLRRQGSVGAGTTPGRVLKGLRMAAHQGADRVTVRNLEILRSDPARALLVVAGAVPGARNGIVMVRKA